jgi:WD40 repeat protein
MEPDKYDAVLGSSTSSPAGAVVLGGLEGVKQRANSPIASERIAALREAQKYGQPGLELILQGLQDRVLAVQKAAYFLLRGSREPKVRRYLKTFVPFPLFEQLGVLEGHRQGITAVAIAPDTRTVISASRDGLIKVWDWWAEEVIFNIPVRRFVSTLTISLDGQILITRGKNQLLQAWSLRNGQEIDPEEQRTRGISSVTLSKDRHLISGSQNLIKIWDLQTGREVCALQGHTSLVTSVSLSPNRQLLVSGSEDKTVRVWGIA